LEVYGYDLSSIEIGAIFTAIGGGMTFLYNFLKKRKEDKGNQDQKALEREINYSKQIESRLMEAEEKAERLMKENVVLQIQNSNVGTTPADVLNEIIVKDPGIIWAKKRQIDEQGNPIYIMLSCSFGYARVFLGGSPESYNGKSDYEIWPKDIADQFHKNDESVFMHQHGSHVDEKIKGGPTGITGRFVGRKYPVLLQDGQNYIIGTGHFDPDQK
jgi:hypothetical protein